MTLEIQADAVFFDKSDQALPQILVDTFLTRYSDSKYNPRDIADIQRDKDVKLDEDLELKLRRYSNHNAIAGMFVCMALSSDITYLKRNRNPKVLITNDHCEVYVQPYLKGLECAQITPNQLFYIMRRPFSERRDLFETYCRREAKTS